MAINLPIVMSFFRPNPMVYGSKEKKGWRWWYRLTKVNI